MLERWVVRGPQSGRVGRREACALSSQMWISGFGGLGRGQGACGGGWHDAVLTQCAGGGMRNMEQGLQHAGRVGQGSGKERGDFVLVRTSTGPQMFPLPVVIGDHILRRVVAGSVQRNKNRRVPLPRRRASPSHSRVSGPWEPLSSFWFRRAGVGKGARGAGWQGAVGKREREAGSEQGLRAGGTEAERERGGLRHASWLEQIFPV
jgi:hypothetical protein